MTEFTIEQALAFTQDRIGADLPDDTFQKLGRELERLREDSKFLSGLRAAGVDNWEGYSNAFDFDDDDDDLDDWEDEWGDLL